MATDSSKNASQRQEMYEINSDPHHPKDVEQQQRIAEGHADRGAELLAGERVELTEEDNIRIRKKIDKYILPILIWVYFNQIIDKSVLGVGVIFGLRDDITLTGSEYSLVSSIAPIAQLAWQPFSSYLIVRVPHRILMPGMMLGWGAAGVGMAFANSFAGLLVARFFLGLFEAGCLPLFAVITSQWYRRSEQPFRVALWYGTNGFATMICAAMGYGFAQIPNPALAPWQSLFLTNGLLTVVSVPFVWYFLDNDVASARFLTEHERKQGLERLRANNSGTGAREFKMAHVWEALLEPKSWLFVAMTLCLNVGAAVTNTFGPLILQGFNLGDGGVTALLNIPFGFVQLIVILPASWLAHRFRIKSPFIAGLMLPVLIGLILLYTLDRSQTGANLAGYYLTAFLFGGNPLIVSWMISNIGGSTKKSVIMSLYNAGTSAGNIIGPLLFSLDSAPEYLPGLRSTMGITAALIGVVGLQLVNLVYLNKRQEKKRVANNKPAKIKDLSMTRTYETGGGADDDELGGQAFLDLTDRKNDEFVYVY
ncbi:hypothetical protein MBLNU230_g6550t1 [Neophaeotheca triangularis]